VRAEADLKAAAEMVNAQLDEFVQARSTVWLLASKKVREGLRSLSQAAGDQSDLRVARDDFVNVVRKDLGLPQFPAESHTQ
jgi:hypothetical protein